MAVRLGIVLLVASFVSACATAEEHTAPDTDVPVPMDRIERLAAERYGLDAVLTYLPNPVETYVLVRWQRPKTAQQPIPATSYFVYGVASDTVTVAEDGLPGTVEWADAHHVRVRLPPGAVPVQGDAPHQYLVDVQTGERRAVDNQAADDQQ